MYSDVLEDPRLNEDWKLAAYVRLLAMVNRSESRDGILRLPYRALGVAMGRSRGDVALKRLRLLVKDELSCAALYAHYVVILLPKYLERYGNKVPTKTKTKTKTKNPPVSPPSAAPSEQAGSPESKAREAWPALRAAAATHGVPWIQRPGSAQVRIIAERIKLDGLTPEQLEAIIRGYITLRGTKPDNRFDPLKHLHPSTLYAPKNWPNYLAAAEAPPKRKEPKRTYYEEPKRPPGDERLIADMSQEEVDEMIKKNRKGTIFER